MNVFRFSREEIRMWRIGQFTPAPEIETYGRATGRRRDAHRLRSSALSDLDGSSPQCRSSTAATVRATYMQQPEPGHPRLKPAVDESNSEELIAVIRSEERRSCLGDRTELADQVCNTVLPGPLPIPGRDVEFNRLADESVAFY